MADSYIICATPRSGSTLLCGLLASTEVAGCPDSFFMGNLDPLWAARRGLPLRGSRDAADYGRAYLEAAKRVGRGRTGIFGLRLMKRDLRALSDLIDAVAPGLPSDRARLKAAFGAVLYIHLTREDKLAQAVSLVRAEQTGLWHVAPDGSEVERLAPPSEPAYDADRIAGRLAELKQDDDAWGSWFEDQGIVPLRIGYEALSSDPAEALGRILDALDRPRPAPGLLRPGVAKLADAISQDWMRRFQAGQAGPGQSGRSRPDA